MKKHIMHILFLVSIFNFSARAVDFVYMSEIFYSTPLNEVITAPPFSNGEFIEFYNAGHNPVNMEGWVVRGDGVTKVFTFGSVIILPRSFLILAYRHSWTPDFELSDLFTDMDTNGGQIIYQNRIILTNTREFIRLYDPTGLLRDSIFYGNVTSIQPISARLIATNPNGVPINECRSVQRKVVEFDERGVAVANHLHWHVDLVRPFRHSNAFMPPNIPSIRSTPAPINLNLPNENYIVSITPMEASSEIVIETSLTTINYFDGLGRPTQTVRKGFTPQGNDLVTKIGYDVFGRQQRHWLPVPIANNNGHIVHPDAFETRANALPYYSEGRPFSEIIYESSPLNRVLGNRSPGTAWQNRPTAIRYEANTANEVKHFFINRAGQLQNGGFYNPNTLFRTTSIDEDGKQTTQFTDKLGRTIMTRMRSSHNINHDTYFVYDDFGNLRYMLPPLASAALSSMMVYDDTHEALQHFAFVYKYDERNRQVQKRLPGADWVYYVYDSADRLTLSQDGNQRAQTDEQNRQKWTVYKYDRHGRVIYTGELNIGENFGYWTEFFRNRVVIERYNPAYALIADGSGYTRGYFCDFHPMDMLTVNYYDNYDFLELSAHDTNRQQLSYASKQGFGTKHNDTHGLLTGKRIYILDGSGDFLMEVFYYDYRGRLIQTRAANHLGGFDFTYKQLDFVGNITQSIKKHSARGDSFSDSFMEITEHYTYTYDHAGRLIDTRYRINNHNEILLSRNKYDEIGRLSGKERHNNTDIEVFEYNIRNWLTRIQSGDFEQKLYYNQVHSISGHSFNTPLFNGNISAITWRTSDNNRNGYSFRYDGMNRLLTTPLTIRNGQLRVDGEMSETFTYDKNGNVLSVRRHDDRDVFSSLHMWYNGNQLRKVTDIWGTVSNPYNTKKYPDLANRTTEFYYDANGNMTTDWDRDIMTIQYNLLNLPSLIQFRNGSQILNTYAADGRKLRTRFGTAFGSVLQPLNPGQVRKESFSSYSAHEYAGHIQYGAIYYNMGSGSLGYERGIEFIFNPEGYAGDPIWNVPQYFYSRRDHLGTNREVWRAAFTSWNGQPIAETTVRRTQFYPSGVPWPGFRGGWSQRLFQDMEFIEMHGWDKYDFHARWYCPYTTRTGVPDPLVELRPWESPYSFFGGNPVNRIDPDGRLWWALAKPAKKLTAYALTAAAYTLGPILMYTYWKHEQAAMIAMGESMAQGMAQGLRTTTTVAAGLIPDNVGYSGGAFGTTTAAMVTQFEGLVPPGWGVANGRAPHAAEGLNTITLQPSMPNLGGGNSGGGGNPGGGKIGKGMLWGGAALGTTMILTNRDPSSDAFDAHLKNALDKIKQQQQLQLHSLPQPQIQLQPQFQWQQQNIIQNKPPWQLF